MKRQFNALEIIVGTFLGFVLGCCLTYMVADHYWPKIKVQVHSGPSPFYLPR